MEKITFTAEMNLPEDAINQIIKKIRDSGFVSAKQEDHYFGVAELAEYLNVSRKWLYKRTSQRTIPFSKIDGTLLFKKSLIDEWVTGNNIS